MVKTEKIKYTETCSINKEKHYKLIILIIASQTDYYDNFNKCWKEYMNIFPDVKSFFLYSDENMECDLLVSDDTITYKCEESYIPGILFKTLAAYQFCQNHLSYDFILRTNLSSFIHITRLLKYLDSTPKNEVVCCKLEHFPLLCDDENVNKEAVDKTLKKWLMSSNDITTFQNKKDDWKIYTKTLDLFFGYRNFMDNKFVHYFAGSFILFSNDVIHKLVDKIVIDNVLSKASITTIPDDIVISAIAQLPGIQPSNLIDIEKFSHRCIYEEKPKHYTDDLFFIRNRTDKIYGNRDIDVKNFIEQVREYYNPNFMEN